MLFRRKPLRLFYLPESARFRTTKLDVFVVTVVIIVFMWAFFIDSFHPMLNETDEPIIIITDTGEHTLPIINMQVFIAPIILCYEMLVLVGLDGKRKGRSLPWGLYYMAFKTAVQEKIREGIEEYKEWRKKP